MPTLEHAREHSSPGNRGLKQSCPCTSAPVHCGSPCIAAPRALHNDPRLSSRFTPQLDFSPRSTGNHHSGDSFGRKIDSGFT